MGWKGSWSNNQPIKHQCCEHVDNNQSNQFVVEIIIHYYGRFPGKKELIFYGKFTTDKEIGWIDRVNHSVEFQ